MKSQIDVAKEWLASMRELLSDKQDNPDHVMERIETFEWLIEQAERVEELEENLDHGAKVAVETARRLHQEREQNKRYKQALEFYAERDNYQWEVSYRPQQEIDCMVIDDSGYTARKALDGGNND